MSGRSSASCALEPVPGRGTFFKFSPLHSGRKVVLGSGGAIGLRVEILIVVILFLYIFSLISSLDLLNDSMR